MCRSIIQLRRPEGWSAQDAEAAARQYVRKVSGFRVPSRANTEVFERAIAEIAEATGRLLDGLVVAGRRPE
jgi:hypothetical protein